MRSSRTTAAALGLALLTANPETYASEDDQTSTRVYATLDNSGSMRWARRFRHADQALERWAETVDLRAGLTVELLVAADEVVHEGTFPLRNETDRGDLLDRLRALETKRSSSTVYRKIDEDLAAFVARATRPDEQFGIVFITDGLSDTPATDLKLQELGDQLLVLGGGLYAVVSGSVPNQKELLGAKRRQIPSSQFESRRTQSRCRRLFGPSIAIASPPPVRAEVRERLLGGFAPLPATIQVENSGEIAREVHLQAQAPEGTTVRFVPATLVVSAGGRVEATVEIEVTGPVSGSIAITADGPAGESIETILPAEIRTRPWLYSNGMILLVLAAVATLILGVLCQVSQRPWFIVPIGRPDRGFEIRAGETVPLGMADPAIPPGVLISRRHGRLLVRTAEDPVRLAGVPVQPGRDVRYRLRTPIDAGATSVVLDRRPRRQRGIQPLIVGATEHGEASNDLL